MRGGVGASVSAQDVGAAAALLLTLSAALGQGADAAAVVPLARAVLRLLTAWRDGRRGGATGSAGSAGSVGSAAAELELQGLHSLTAHAEWLLGGDVTEGRGAHTVPGKQALGELLRSVCSV